jgi:membrane protein DedA with SNARE-associated domain
VGTTIWNMLLTFAGMILGQNWERVLSVIDRYEIVVWIILAGLAVFYVIKRLKAWSFNN